MNKTQPGPAVGPNQGCYIAPWTDRIEEMACFGLMHGALLGLQYQVSGNTKRGVEQILSRVSEYEARKPMPLTCNCKAKASCVDSRVVEQYRRRRYLCPSCGKRWSSVEVVVGELEGRGKVIALLQDRFANQAYLRLRQRLVEILREEGKI